MATQTLPPKDYENNPFFIATKGLSLLFNFAQGVGIVLVILSIGLSFSGGPSVPEDNNGNPAPDQITQTLSGWTPNEWITFVGAVTIIGAAIVLLAALFGGVSAYTSAQLARGKRVALNDAFKVAFEHLWSFLWLQIIIFVKLLLWTLLFIIPGIIMSVRYSLASVAFFDKDLRGNAAIKESLRLTKGAWITTFAGNALLNYLTLGVISWVIATGSNAILYKQYSGLGENKPPAHWLSWLTLVLPFALMALLLFFVIAILGVIASTGGKFSE
jgi:hypothetical protein